MSGVNFECAKLQQGYLQQMQRPACGNCQLRLAHHMQCGRGGFYVQAFGICDAYKGSNDALKVRADFEREKLNEVV